MYQQLKAKLSTVVPDVELRIKAELAVEINRLKAERNAVILGHNHPESGLLQPAVAPPGFDLEASRETIRRLRELHPRTICFSQFGQRDDASFVIEEAERQLEAYHRFILTRLERGLETRRIADEIADLLLEDTRAANRPKSEGDREFLRSMLASIVVGYQVYFRRSGRLG
jgi:hypothetical protein